jgi:hypothetical protein
MIDLVALCRQRQRREAQIIRDAAQAITDGDRARLADMIGDLEYHWRPVFRRLARTASAINPDMRAVWLQIRIRWGASLRDRAMIACSSPRCAC